MPINRNALIRYQTIDTCLRNRHRKWTLEDLIEACSNMLYEYEGIDKGVSRRTVQMDIQMMRSEKLGYNAPIVVLDKKYYTYEDPNYSITNIPLTDGDLHTLKEVTEILKQFKGFDHFRELSGMVQRLEDKIRTAKTQRGAIIDFEKNDNLKGLEYIEVIYQAILQKQCLSITYQSFKAKSAQTFIFHAYLLKEYRNRWFVLGIRHKARFETLLALDRILEIKPSEEWYCDNETLDIENYFRDIVGVTIMQGQPTERILLLLNKYSAPYVLTKPIHHSQQIVETREDGVVISLDVQINYEMEREILGFGETVKVLAPRRLQNRIKQKIQHMTAIYQPLEGEPESLESEAESTE
ncbi:helix-turn-helix transcriptional regulator [Xanthocytophaga flava]|uniref:helix-turn-helix transcriptional regulator n=1 Tax=Xanthocytophaga flava TaxID=3048013 RepID=UPI0028D183A0|nr:WYL domain-containing protein [Xanthocytophaga flavus]MDJ1469631.1 WYL domain-containing protein [Xanthocytophaga flavus]